MTNPVQRFGLELFQMVVNGRPALLYAGRNERDAVRYCTMEGNRLVFKYRGDVLYSGDSDMYVCEADPEQTVAWSNAFAAATARGESDPSDPIAFALPLDPTE